jgi:Sec7-like guanine-nucleotide exchange factor
MPGKDKAAQASALKARVESAIFNAWDKITRKNVLQEKMPEGITVAIKTYYDGGRITLTARRAKIMEIEREVEYLRTSITISSPFNTRSDKLLGLFDRIIPEIVQEQNEIDRQALLRAREEANSPALEVIDALPDPFEM